MCFLKPVIINTEFLQRSILAKAESAVQQKTTIAEMQSITTPSAHSIHLAERKSAISPTKVLLQRRNSF
jgi:hypothetical protein